MIIIDTSVLIFKNLFSAINHSTDINGKPIKKYDGLYKTDDFIRLWKHKMMNDIRYIYKDKKHTYGELVLALDNHDGPNWRKQIFSPYKANRKSDRDKSEVNFKEFFKYSNEFIDEVQEIFGFRVLSVKGAEGDDVVGVLAEAFSPREDIYVVSTDKDFLQLFSLGNVTIFNPLKLKQVPKMSKEELGTWLNEHIMQGDVADGVPKVVADTEFSKEFISYLQNNDIYEDKVYEFNQLSISNKLMNEFIEKYPEVNPFKKTRFGPVALKAFMEDFKTNMDKNPLYWPHYRRNEELVLFSSIPNEVTNDILSAYNSQNPIQNIGGIASFFMKHQLIELYTNYQDFFIPKSGSVGIASSASHSSVSTNSDSSNTKFDVSNVLDDW